MLIALSSATGCTTSKKSFLPTGTLTAKEVYYGAQRDSSIKGNKPYPSRTVPLRPLEDNELHLNAYALTSSPKPDYQLLPNPTLYLFVNTRLSVKNRIPIPSYITEFKMLATDEYALPGEFSAIQHLLMCSAGHPLCN
ncbi:hypothetical protein [uncultured Shewanella sp.]|uniref:hypothetical protein n=1 Tax=uncultured Shewanella sp. TaxID=173975 RepID=UPI00260EAFCD|nr:hypothetical protein [uncultured Shewanella sp.]